MVRKTLLGIAVLAAIFAAPAAPAQTILFEGARVIPGDGRPAVENAALLVEGGAISRIGRMQCYALAAAGEAGIVRLLELLEDEVKRCLGLLGVRTFAELDRSCLHRAEPVTAPHVLSAFPLLEIEAYRY